MINQMNLIKKSLLGLFLSCFIVTGYADASNYEVGDVFEAKKRTTAVLLYVLKNDLLLDKDSIQARQVLLGRETVDTFMNFRKETRSYFLKIMKLKKYLELRWFLKGNQKTKTVHTITLLQPSLIS